MDDQEFAVKLNYVCLFSCFSLHCFVTSLHLISSFLCIISSFVQYGYVSTKSINFILLSSLALKVILLASSANTLCFLLLNLCCDFSINLLFLMNSLQFSQRLSILRLYFSSWFFLFLS